MDHIGFYQVVQESMGVTEDLWFNCERETASARVEESGPAEPGPNKNASTC